MVDILPQPSSQIIVLPQGVILGQGQKKPEVNPLKRKLESYSAPPPAPRKRANLDHLSNEEKLMRRKLKNRVAAQNARDKKKVVMDEMEDTIKKLQDQVNALREQNQTLIVQNDILLEENQTLKKGFPVLPPSPPDSFVSCDSPSSSDLIEQTFVVSRPWSDPAERTGSGEGRGQGRGLGVSVLDVSGEASRMQQEDESIAVEEESLELEEDTVLKSEDGIWHQLMMNLEPDEHVGTFNLDPVDHVGTVNLDQVEQVGAVSLDQLEQVGTVKEEEWEDSFNELFPGLV